MSSVSTVSLRLANITGPRLAIGPIPTFYKRLKVGQSCFCSDTKRDFLDIQDFFALMDIVMRCDAPTGVYNVSTGKGHSIKEIYDIVKKHVAAVPEKDPPIIPCGDDDVPEVVLDPAVTQQTFSWQAKVGFVDAIENMLQWYDNHGVTDVYSHLASGAKE